MFNSERKLVFYGNWLINVLLWVSIFFITLLVSSTPEKMTPNIYLGVGIELTILHFTLFAYFSYYLGIEKVSRVIVAVVPAVLFTMVLFALGATFLIQQKYIYVQTFWYFGTCIALLSYIVHARGHAYCYRNITTDMDVKINTGVYTYTLANLKGASYCRGSKQVYLVLVKIREHFPRYYWALVTAGSSRLAGQHWVVLTESRMGAAYEAHFTNILTRHVNRLGNEEMRRLFATSIVHDCVFEIPKDLGLSSYELSLLQALR